MASIVRVKVRGLRGPGLSEADQSVLQEYVDDAEDARDLARAYAISDTDESIPGAVDPSDRGAKFYADLSGDWAEGTEPGGPGTKSSKGHAEDAGDFAESASASAAGAAEAVEEALSDFFTDPASAAAGGAASALPAAPLAYRKIRLPDGTRFMVPVYASIEPLDLFVIVGQSNGQGSGDSSLSPTAPDGVFIDGSTINPPPLVDPVGGANTGSMWPAFALEHYERTGRMLAIVEAATGGTALIPDQAGNNWSPSGSLRAAAALAANQAIAAINDADNYTLGDVRFIWVQGEQEAENINGSTITGPLYKAALETLAAYFKDQVPEMVEMLVVRTGSRNDYQRAAGWAEIRAAQEDACTDSELLRMVYRGTFGFNYTGRRLMGDAVHYSQPGLNEAGRMAARYAAGEGQPPVPTAPSLLASASWMDTDLTPTNGRTVSHTTAPGTKALIVSVGMARQTGSTAAVVSSVKFGGVEMVKANALTGALAAARSTAPSGRVDVGVFVLTEGNYPGGLSSVTADIAVSSTSMSVPLISIAAFDLDAPVLPDVAISALLTGDVTASDTFALSLYTGAPAFVVGVCATVADSGSALTHALSGLTEIADAGAASSGRSGQVAFGHATVGEVSGEAISAVLTGAASTGLLHVAAFRGLIDGETTA